MRLLVLRLRKNIKKLVYTFAYVNHCYRVIKYNDRTTEARGRTIFSIFIISKRYAGAITAFHSRTIQLLLLFCRRKHPLFTTCIYHVSSCIFIILFLVIRSHENQYTAALKPWCFRATTDFLFYYISIFCRVVPLIRTMSAVYINQPLHYGRFARLHAPAKSPTEFPLFNTQPLQRIVDAISAAPPSDGIETGIINTE